MKYIWKNLILVAATTLLILYVYDKKDNLYNSFYYFIGIDNFGLCCIFMGANTRDWIKITMYRVHLSFYKFPESIQSPKRRLYLFISQNKDLLFLKNMYNTAGFEPIGSFLLLLKNQKSYQ